jgi:hypothetical protein
MPWYTNVDGSSTLSMPNGSLYLTEVRGAFSLEYRSNMGIAIHTWAINVPSLYEARRLSMDIVRNYLLSEAKYLETTNPTLGVSYGCDNPLSSTASGKVRVGCCPTCKTETCKCKRVPYKLQDNCHGY